MRFFLNHWHLVLLFLAWGVALAWVWRVMAALLHLSHVPDLLRAEYDVLPEKDGRQPTLTVIVPARNEGKDIEAALRSLLQQDYPQVQVLAVDDRSTDATGDIMDRVAAESEGKLRVIHIRELPEGWMGKTHAMALAARQCTTDWILFTDGDIFYRPDAIRRTLAMVEKSQGDHLVVFPTMILRSWGERMMISFFQSVTIWAARPWRIADPKSKRDYIGIGAFNLIRREVYQALGGYESLRMEVLEDVRLGYKVKQAGYAQRVAFGRGLVNVHWAAGAFGIVNVLTKNMFSAFRFRPGLLVLACFWMLLFCFAPFAGIFMAGGIRLACAVTLFAVFLAYWVYAPRSGIHWIYALTYPLSTCLFIYTLMRSMLTTLVQGGVIWRGTLYPLKELRKNAGPLW
ncbi:MAG: glycosyltransferase [Acidobacteriaceae bacterium]